MTDSMDFTFEARGRAIPRPQQSTKRDYDTDATETPAPATLAAPATTTTPTKRGVGVGGVPEWDATERAPNCRSIIAEKIGERERRNKAFEKRIRGIVKEKNPGSRGDYMVFYETGTKGDSRSAHLGGGSSIPLSTFSPIESIVRSTQRAHAGPITNSEQLSHVDICRYFDIIQGLECVLAADPAAIIYRASYYERFRSGAPLKAWEQFIKDHHVSFKGHERHQIGFADDAPARKLPSSVFPQQRRSAFGAPSHGEQETQSAQDEFVVVAHVYESIYTLPMQLLFRQLSFEEDRLKLIGYYFVDLGQTSFAQFG